MFGSLDVLKLKNAESSRRTVLKFIKSHIFPSPATLSARYLPDIPAQTMTARPASRALRQCARQLAAPAVQRRTFVSALSAARVGAVAPKAAVTSSLQQVRGVKTVDFAGHKETVYGTIMLDTNNAECVADQQ
jgi:hypothetical protein